MLRPDFLSSTSFNNPATPSIYTLSLHDALPISSTSSSFCVSIRRGGNAWVRHSICRIYEGPAVTLRNLNEPLGVGCVLYSRFEEERMRRVLEGEKRRIKDGHWEK